LYIKYKETIRRKTSMTKQNMRTGAAAILLGAAVLTGCASSQASAPQAAAQMPNYIQVETVNNHDTITIQASEAVKVVPDMAAIVYGINSENKDAQACQQENSEKVGKVLEYFKGQGIAEASIATSDFSLNPMYDWSGNQRILTGYEMRTQVTVSDVPMDQVGALISQAVAAGANEIISVNYLSSKYDEAYEEALTKAVAQAKAKAEAMAHAENYQVISVVSMEEMGDSQQGRYVDSGLARNMASVKMEAAADMAVMAGEMDVTARIQVVYQIAPR